MRRRIDRFGDWLAGLKTWHIPRSFHANRCPHCGHEPYPAGTCPSCGLTRPDQEPLPLFSMNHWPAMVFALISLGVVLSAIGQLIIYRGGDIVDLVLGVPDYLLWIAATPQRVLEFFRSIPFAS